MVFEDKQENSDIGNVPILISMLTKESFYEYDLYQKI